MNPRATLITGACSGFGPPLAREFAAHGHPLVLVAPRKADLETLARELRAAHGVGVRAIAKDPERPESARDIFDDLEADGTAVDILVNNPGPGCRGRFRETPIEDDLTIIRLNVVAPLRFTKLFLPPMIRGHRGRILNIVPTDGSGPDPLPGGCQPTMAFLRSWSEELALELEGTGVHVGTLIAPAAFWKVKVAKAAYQGLMNGDRLIAPGGTNKPPVTAGRISGGSAPARANWN